MLQTRKAQGMSLCGLAAFSCVLVVCGCSEYKATSKQEKPSEEFIADLRSRPLIRTDGLAVAGMGPKAAVLQAKGAAEERGLDLFRLYKAHQADPRVRHSLVYMMLLLEDTNYLCDIRRAKKLGKGDLAIIRFVLDDSEADLSKGYRDAVSEAINDIDGP